jgi:hypothetical protein
MSLKVQIRNYKCCRNLLKVYITYEIAYLIEKDLRYDIWKYLDVKLDNMQNTYNLYNIWISFDSCILNIVQPKSCKLTAYLLSHTPF